MFSHRLSLICACAAGLLLAGCEALRGPQPFGPTYVAPPGPVARVGTVRAVPPAPQYPGYGQPQYGAPVYGQPPALPGAPPYAPNTPPAYGPGAQSQYGPVPGAAVGQLTLRIGGGAQATVGSAVGYRFDIANASPRAARNIVVTCDLPGDWTYVASNPAGIVSGRRIQWQMRELGANQTTAIDVTLRPAAPGAANLCATLASDAGAPVQTCATTRVELPAAPGSSQGGPAPAPASSLDVAIAGPDRAAPGDNVTFNITVTNRGATRATGLLVTDTFGAGLVHEKATSPIERDLKDIEPGQSQAFKVTFRVARPGRHCHDIVVTGAGGLRAAAQACVVASGSPRVSVRQGATPTATTVGATVRFAIDIKNEGDVDLTAVVVSPSFDRALRPTQATEVRGRQALVNLKNDRYELSPWRFDRLEPGRAIQLDVECRAESVSARACGRVTVTTQDGPREEAVTCVKIEAAAGGGAGGAAQ